MLILSNLQIFQTFFNGRYVIFLMGCFLYTRDSSITMHTANHSIYSEVHGEISMRI